MLEVSQIVQKIKLFEFSEENLSVARALKIPEQKITHWLLYHGSKPPPRPVLKYLVPYCLRKGLNIEDFLTASIPANFRKENYEQTH